MGTSQSDNRLLAEFTLLPDAAKTFFLQAHPELLQPKNTEHLLDIAEGKEGEAISDLRWFGLVDHQCRHLRSMLPENWPCSSLNGGLRGCYYGPSHPQRLFCFVPGDAKRGSRAHE
jgi:hypothetical protein